MPEMQQFGYNCGAKMTQEEHDKWEEYYQEAARRDFERWIYKCQDEEDAKGSREQKEIK